MIVVDTHIIIWNALKPEMLSEKAEKAISAANNSDGIIFCEISLWEIAMLMHKGRLSIDIEYLEFIHKTDIRVQRIRFYGNYTGDSSTFYGFAFGQ